jgi:hypothetical protein
LVLGASSRGQIGAELVGVGLNKVSMLFIE